MNQFSVPIKRVLQRAEAIVLRYGAMPQTMFTLAAMTALDGFIPMLPAEGFVIALCVLQSQRSIFIVLLFALASAMSAYLLALLLGTLNFWLNRSGSTFLARNGIRRPLSFKRGGQVAWCFYLPFQTRQGRQLQHLL